MLVNNSLKAKLADEAKKQANKFSWDKFVTKILEAIHRQEISKIPLRADQRRPNADRHRS